MTIFSLVRYLCVATAVVLLAGCTSGQPASGGITPTTSQRMHRQPPPCAWAAVKVWASKLGPKVVEGYRANGTPIACTVNTGIASGTAFYAPFGLASDPAGNLYVADVNNRRVVVFNSTGGYVATSNTSLEPVGVCVSPTGILGVAERGIGGSGAGVIEFFTSGLTSNSSASGYATGSGSVADTFQWCAFDRAGNFFSTGTTSPTAVQEVTYLPDALVNLPAETMVNSGISTAPYWISMYVQLRGSNTNGEVLAVEDPTPEIQFFKINPISGAPGPTASSTLALTGYPSGSDKMYQDAPNMYSTKATIYFADYGASEVLKTKEYSGAISVFHTPVSQTVGIATNPTGQE
ncbi:MAG TPA: hypothetical protein VKR56_12480 [Candidatus Cybelea sp.]|nr:hypothetical protein [Candidatus Cybelea sp.]